MTEIEKLRKSLKKANDEYHEAVDALLASGVFVEHKCQIATRAQTIFNLMKEILAFPLEEK